MNEELQSLMDLAVSKGWSNDGLRKVLQDANYSSQDINSAMSYYDSKKKSQSETQQGGASASQSQAQNTSSASRDTRFDAALNQVWNRNGQPAEGSIQSIPNIQVPNQGPKMDLETLRSMNNGNISAGLNERMRGEATSRTDVTFAQTPRVFENWEIEGAKEDAMGDFIGNLTTVRSTAEIGGGTFSSGATNETMAETMGWADRPYLPRGVQLALSGVTEEEAKVPTNEVALPPSTIMRTNFSGAEGENRRKSLQESYEYYQEIINGPLRASGLEEMTFPDLFIEDEKGYDVGNGVKEILNPEAVKYMVNDLREIQQKFAEEQKEYEEQLKEEGEAWGNNALTRFGINVLATALVSWDQVSTWGEGSGEFGEAGRALFETSGRLSYADKITDFDVERVEMGISGNLTDGTWDGFVTGMGLMGTSVLDNAPNLALIVASRGAALPYLGLMSGQQAYASVYDNPEWSDLEKFSYGVAVGAAEYFTEKVFNADITAASTFMASKGLKFGTQASKKELGDLMFGWMPKAARAPIEEGFEELIVSTVDEGFAAMVEGREMNKFELVEATLAGMGAGGGIHVASRGFSSVGKISNLSTKYTIQNNIANISNLVNDPTISQKEKEILQDKLVDYQRQAAEIESDAFAFYSNMSRRDVNSVIKLNQAIKSGLKEYQEMKTDEGRAAAAKKVKDAVAKKRRIEDKYDSKTEQQVPSTVQEGQTTEQGQPVAEASKGKAKAGRVFQTPLQAVKAAQSVLNYPKAKLKSIKVNTENVGEALQFLRDGANKMSDKVFEATKTNRRSVMNAINSIENVVKTIAESGAETEIIAHTDGKSFNKAVGEEGSARAMHITKEGQRNQIHILVPAVMSNTIYHEAVHELIPNVMGAKGISKVAKKLRSVIKQDQFLSTYMAQFESQYGEADKDTEFMAEISSLIADGSISIDVKRGIAAKFVESISEVLGKVFNVAPTNNQLIEAMNYMANQLATGQAVEYQEKTAEPLLTEDGYRYIEDRPLLDNSAEPGDIMAHGVMSSDDINQAQKITFSPISFNVDAYTEMKGANLVFPKSQTDMKSALDKSGGAWVIINSDGTGVGTTEGGVELYGGIGFSFIEQNIKDQIGFAASSDNKITELAAKIARTAESRDVFYPEHAGKPVAVFVMVQTPGAAFGNHYGANFLADALYETVRQGVMTQEQVKEQFNEYVDNQISLAQGLADARIEKGENASKELGKIAKFNLIKTTVNEADLSTKKGHDSIQKLVSSDNKIDFGTRREFIEGFIPNVSKTRGPGGELRTALIGLGFNMPNFIDTYLDKNLSSQLVGKNQTDRNKDGGYVVSGFYVENPTDTQGFVAKSKSGTFKHPQFNSQFHGTDPFLLNGKYYVNEIFEPQQFKSAKTGSGVPITASVAASMYVSSEYTPGEGVRFRSEDMYLEGLKQIEQKISEASKSKVQYQKGDSPDFASRYKDVKTSNLNTYGVATSIFTDIQNMLNDKESAVHLLDKKDLYLPVMKQESGDKDKSRYMSFTSYSQKLKKKINIDIRIADHTVPLSETVRSKEFNETGYHKRSKTGDKVFSAALNIWDKPSYLEVKRRLEMYGFEINKVDPEYFMYNNRTFKEQKFNLYNNLVDFLNSYTTFDSEGNNIIGVELDEFVRIAEMLGMSSQAAKEMYDQQLSNKLGYETKGTEWSDSLYEESLEKEKSLRNKSVSLWRNLVVKTTDRQSTVKNAIIKAGLDNAKDLLVNRAGAGAYARYVFEKFDSKVYKGLKFKHQSDLDLIIFLRRVIQIDENFDGRRRMADLAVAELKAEYAAWLQDNLNNISTEAKKKEADYKSRIQALEKAAKEIQRPQHQRSSKYENVTTNKESATRELRQIENKLGEKLYADLYKRSDAYFNAFRSLLNEMYEEGLIDQDTYDAIKEFNYQPRMFLEHVYNEVSDDIAMREYGLSQNQIKKITTGSEAEMMLQSRFILNLYARSVTARIAKNKANKALAEGLKDKKNNDWIRPSNEGKADRGFENVYFYENGEQKSFQLRTDLRREWDDLNLSMAGKTGFGKVMGYLSGSFALKLLATRANPLFVLGNFPRDFGHIIFLTNAYDNHNIYYSGLLLFRDFFKGLKSKITDDQYYQDYMRLGGGMDFLSTEGRRESMATKTVGRVQEAVLKATSSIGEASEVGFRIAVYKKVLNNSIKEYESKNGEKPTGETLEQLKSAAVTQSREIIDFSQGGSFIKGAEIATPYLNAAFQGMRVSSAYIRKNPVAFARKWGEVTLGLTMLMLYNFTVGEDEWDDIPAEIKKRNHIIFTPFTYTDEQGRTRRRYITIPKTQQMIPFYAVSEYVAASVASEVFEKEVKFTQDDFDYLTSSVMSYLPKDPSNIKDEALTSIPVISAITAYQTNYDAFRKQRINIEDGVPPEREGLYDESVPLFYKAYGELTGTSPKRMQVAVEKIITSPYSSPIVGGSYVLLNEAAKEYWEPDLKYSEGESIKKAELFKGGAWEGLLRMGKIRTTSPDWKMYNRAEEIDAINQASGADRQEIKNLARQYANEWKTAGSQSDKDQVVQKVDSKMQEIVSDNRNNGLYFRDTFRTYARISGSSQEINEIKYATDHVARAKIIRLILEERGGTSLQDIQDLRAEMKENGYDIPAETAREYVNEYGKPE